MIDDRPFARVIGGEVVESHRGDEPLAWWSFGKTVLAAAALKLVDRGDLDLDGPWQGEPYSLRQLLQHRAGLPDYGPVRAYHQAVAAGEPPWSRARLLASLPPAPSPPGAAFHYSNIGYMQVRDAVAAAYGGDLQRALNALVLAPLGVSARVARTTADLSDIAYVLAGYDPGWVYHDLIVGRIGEAALLLDRLLGGALLRPDLLVMALEIVPIGYDVPDRPLNVAGYGLGLMGEADPGSPKVIGHTGGGPDGTIVVRHVPGDPPQTLAIAGPGHDQGEIERELLRRAGWRQPPQPVDPLDVVGDPPDLAGRICEDFVCAPFVFEGRLMASGHVTWFRFGDEWRSLAFDHGTIFWRGPSSSPRLPEGHPDRPFNPLAEVGRQAGVIGQRLLDYAMVRTLRGSRVDFRFESGVTISLDDVDDVTSVAIR